MTFYGVVSAQTEVVEFPRARAAEAMVDEVGEDEHELAAALRVDEVELGGSVGGS
jgi:hypothetical protein